MFQDQFYFLKHLKHIIAYNNNNNSLFIYLLNLFLCCVIVKPHLTREEFLHTEFLVNEFASGIGKELQRKLELRAKSMRNWVTVNGFVCLSITL